MNCFRNRPISGMASWASVVALALVLGAPVPARAKGNDPPKIHEVYSGQTLGMIAKRYNVTVDALIFANRIKRRNRIQAGQKLIIPTLADKAGSEARRLRDGGYLTDRKVRRRVAEARRARSQPKRRPESKRVVAPPAASERRAGHKLGYVTLVGFTDTWKGFVIAKGGKLTDSSRKGFERVLVSKRTGKHHKISRDLIRLVARVSDHFRGRPIHVVSGYRPKSVNRYSSHSRHNVGRAIDFRIPGVKNSELRDYVRTLGNVGVGYYPNSSFVHLDVRKRSTYWVDYSGPGEAPRYARPDGPDPRARADKPEDTGSTDAPSKPVAAERKDSKTSSRRESRAR